MTAFPSFFNKEIVTKFIREKIQFGIVFKLVTKEVNN